MGVEEILPGPYRGCLPVDAIDAQHVVEQTAHKRRQNDQADPGHRGFHVIFRQEDVATDRDRYQQMDDPQNTKELKIEHFCFYTINSGEVTAKTNRYAMQYAH
jgi:hypothetical protein